MSDLFGIGIPKEWTDEVLWVIKENPQHRFYLLTKQPRNLIKFSPFPENCWVGVTATDDAMAWSAMVCLEGIEARIKYISFEPLLASANGGYRLSYIERVIQVVQWVIIGAQTKPYKPPKIEWTQEIVTACDKAGVAVFLKDNLKPLFTDELGRTFYPEWALNSISSDWTLRQEMPNA